MTSKRRVHGFTLVELLAVLVLLGILAAVALPRLDLVSSMRSAAWRDQVLAALRQAQSLSQGHRRMVCVDVATGSVALSIASTHPAAACGTALAGPDGATPWARDSGAPATAVSPAGTLYVQPSGRVTLDAAGTTATSRSITIAGEDAITVVGETGLAQ